MKIILITHNLINHWPFPYATKNFSKSINEHVSNAIFRFHWIPHTFTNTTLSIYFVHVDFQYTFPRDPLICICLKLRWLDFFYSDRIADCGELLKKKYFAIIINPVPKGKKNTPKTNTNTTHLWSKHVYIISVPT